MLQNPFRSACLLGWLMAAPATVFAQVPTNPPESPATAVAPPPALPPPAPGFSPAGISASGGLGVQTSTANTLPSAAAPSVPPPAPVATPPVTPTAISSEPRLPPPPLAGGITPPNAALTDHEQVIGAWGFGLLGSAELRNLGPGNSFIDDPLRVAIIGARHWLNRRVGLELGAGFNYREGTRIDSVPGKADVDEPTVWAVAVRAGVPFSLYSDQHYNFLFLPDLNLGYSTGRTLDDGNTLGDQGISSRAWLLSVGARVGAEIQFGFIGIPMLSLQGSVGAALAYRAGEREASEAGATVTRRKWTLQGETASYNNPWELFTGAISAVYYVK